MTELEELELLELEAQELAAQTDAVIQENAPPKSEATWLNRARAGLQGMTLGASDEIGSGIAAGAAWLGDDTGKGYGDIYDEMHQSLQDERETYERDHAGEALALNLVGGLATGGLGFGRSAAATGAKGLSQALDKGRKAADFGGDIVAASRAADKARKAQKLAQIGKGTAIAAGESAVAGALSADQGERTEGALKGATIGLGLPLALRGAGKVVKGAARNRMSQQLGKGEDFIGLNIASRNSLLGKGYTNLVGRAFGGEGAIKDQTMKYLNRAKKAVGDASENLGLTKSRVESAGRRQLAGIDRNAKAQTDEVAEIAQLAQARAAAEAKDAARAARASARNEVKEIAQDTRTTSRAARELGDVRAEEITGQAQQNVRQLEGDFAADIRQQMIPDAMPPQTREKIAQQEPLDALETIDNWWSTDGFNTVKNESFTLDDDAVKGFVDDVAESVGNDPALANAIANPRTYVTTLINKYRDKETGVIGGDALMEIRNNFARMINPGAQGSGGLTNAASSKVRQRVDDTIIEQFGEGSELALLFQDELARYGTVSAARQAARAAAKRGEMFNMDEYLAGVLRRGGKETTYHRGPQQKEAYEGINQRTNILEQGKQEATRAKEAGQLDYDQIRSQGGENIAAVRQQGTEAVDDIRMNEVATREGVKETAETAKQRIQAQKLREDKTAKRLTANSQETADAQARQNLTEKEWDFIKTTLPSEGRDVGFWEKIVATGILSAIGAPLGVGGHVVAGGSAAKVLANPKVQRALVGQTDKQQALAKLIKAYEGSSAEALIDMLTRLTTRQTSAAAGEG